MHRLIAATLLMALIGCSRGAGSVGTTTVLSGHYGQARNIGSLKLLVDGTYECFIFNGITSDGCATFEGAGVSRGSWSVADGVISFEPTNHGPDDLVVDMGSVCGVVADGGIVLTVDGDEFLAAYEGPSNAGR